MYVFLSHCVKPDDPPLYIQSKNLLVERLESAGFGVFEYISRPGWAENWMKDIRDRLRISAFVVYFAKQWPEPDPGVCLIELGAAKILDIPVYLFHPGKYSRAAPMFSEYAQRLERALKNPQDTVFSDAEALVNRLLTARHGVEKPSGLFGFLSDVFIFQREPQGDPLQQTGNVLNALRAAKRSEAEGGLGLRKFNMHQPLQKVVGYWRIPGARHIIVLRDEGSGRSKISPYTPAQTSWTNAGDFLIPLPPLQLLEETFSIGNVLETSTVCFLMHNGSEWRLIGFKLDILLTNVAPELAQSSRRSCLRRFSNGTCGMFADSDFYELIFDPGSKVGTIRRSDQIPADSTDPYFAPPSVLDPPRLTSVIGARELTVLIEGGRAEAIFADDIYWAVQQTRDVLYLGTWEPIDTRELLSCLRREKDDVDCRRWADPIGFTLMPGTQENSPLDWYWRSIKDWIANYVGGTTWFNDNYEEPRIYEVDCSGVKNLAMRTPPPHVVYAFDLKWTDDLKVRLRRVLQGH